MNGIRKNYSFIILILILILLAAAIFIFIYMRIAAPNNEIDELTQELTDEFSRIRWFILDWYSEMSDYGKCSVFLNELSFKNAEYSLTFANNRIRAVYPRGERFFKLELVKRIEFFEVNGVLRCRLIYGNSGEYMFKVN